MTELFCRQCVEARLGPAAVEEARRRAASAPPLSPEQRMHLRALFESARVFPGDAQETRRKTCGHDDPTET